MDSKLIINVLDLAIQYGAPLVKQAIENSGKDVITQEDIDNLKIDDKNAEDWEFWKEEKE